MAKDLLLDIPHQKENKSAYFSCLSLYYILLHLLRFQVREACLLKRTWPHMF